MKNLTIIEKKLLIVFRDYAKMMLDSSYKVKQNGTKQEEKEQRAARLKILTPKQMLQRLSIALAQAKAGSNSESLLNKIRQIVYSLYQ